MREDGLDQDDNSENVPKEDCLQINPEKILPGTICVGEDSAASFGKVS